MNRWDWLTTPAAHRLIEAMETRGYQLWLVGTTLHRHLEGHRTSLQWDFISDAPMDFWDQLRGPLGATAQENIEPRQHILRWGVIRITIQEMGYWHRGSVRAWRRVNDWDTWALYQPSTMAMTAWDVLHDRLWDTYGGHDAWLNQTWTHPDPEQALRAQPPSLMAYWGWQRRTGHPIAESWWQAMHRVLEDSQWWSAATYGWQSAWDHIFWEQVRSRQWGQLVGWWDRLGLLNWLIPDWQSRVSTNPASLRFRARLLRLSATATHPAQRLAALFQDLPLGESAYGDHGLVAAERWTRWATRHHIPRGTVTLTRLLVASHHLPPALSGPEARPLRDQILFGRWQSRQRSWVAYRMALRWRQQCLVDRAALKMDRWIDLRIENRKRVYRPRRPPLTVGQLDLDADFFIELGHVPSPGIFRYLLTHLRRRHLRNRRRDLFIYAAYYVYGPAWIDRFPALVQSLYRDGTDLSALRLDKGEDIMIP